MLAMMLPQAPLSNSSLLPPWPTWVGEVPKILPCAGCCPARATPGWAAGRVVCADPPRPQRGGGLS